MAITQNHIINIQPGVSAPLVIHCSQGDTGSVINLTVVNGDETFDCSSYVCSVHGVRSDGANWGPYEVTVSGSTVSFSLRQEMTAIAGPCLAEITIGTVGTANFAILVENATFSLGVTYTEDVSLYQSILNYIMGATQNIKTEATATVNKALDQMNTKANDLQNQYAVTNAKLDTAISAATQDSEVQDIRVKANGKSATTAGNAVREQVTELKNDFNAERDYSDRQIIYGENRYYYDQSRLINDKYISLYGDSGSFEPYDGWSITDFIPVDANSEYIMAYYSNGTYKQSNNNYYARYDKDFKFISAPSPGDVSGRATITTDANTKYVRISQLTTRFSSMTIVVKKTIFDAGVSGKIPFYIRFIGDDGIEGLKSDVSELKSDVSELKSDVSELKNTNNDKVMRSICRMGEAYGQPESVAALKSCHAAGYNIIRVNLQFSSDGTAVLWHDPYINQYMKSVYDSSGALVPYSETDKIKISDTPLATLNQYKWGGASYATGIPTAEAIINAARKAGMELYFECKMILSEANINTIVSLIEKYGMRNRVSFAVLGHVNGKQIATQAQDLRIGFMNGAFSEQLKSDYLSLKDTGAKMFWWGWDTMALTSEIVAFLSENGIDYECGDFKSYSAINTYLSAEYAWYCTGMEIQGAMSPLIGQYIENNI